MLWQVGKSRHTVYRIAEDIASNIDNICCNGTARRHHSGAKAVEQDVADSIAREMDGV